MEVYRQPAATRAEGGDVLRPVHALELPLDHLGRCEGGCLGRSQPDAAPVHRLHAVRRHSLAAARRRAAARRARDRDGSGRHVGLPRVGGVGRRRRPVQRACRLRECECCALPHRLLAGRRARLTAGDAVARPWPLARRRWSAASARSARPESRLAAGLCARARALSRAGTGSSAVAGGAAYDRRGDGALDGAIARGVPSGPGGGPSAGAGLCQDGARPHGSRLGCRGGPGRAARAESGTPSDRCASDPAPHRRLAPRGRAGGDHHGRVERAHVSPRRRDRERPLRPMARRCRRVREPADPGSGGRQLRSRIRARAAPARGAALSAQH